MGKIRVLHTRFESKFLVYAETSMIWFWLSYVYVAISVRAIQFQISALGSHLAYQEVSYHQSPRQPATSDLPQRTHTQTQKQDQTKDRSLEQAIVRFRITRGCELVVAVGRSSKLLSSSFQG